MDSFHPNCSGVHETGSSPVETLVRGETREIIAAQEQAAKAQLAAQGARSRMKTISRLVAFQQQLADGVPTESLK